MKNQLPHSNAIYTQVEEKIVTKDVLKMVLVSCHTESSESLAGIYQLVADAVGQPSSKITATAEADNDKNKLQGVDCNQISHFGKQQPTM